MTVVTGLPRSGTSMLMQMLAAGGIPPLSDGERLPDDDNPRGYFELESVKRLQKDSSWLSDAQGKAVKIIAQLLPNLPQLNYRLIFMDRDLDEVIESQRRMLLRNGRQGDDTGRGSTQVGVFETNRCFGTTVATQSDSRAAGESPAMH